jgi:hypothetical protein
MAAPRNKAEAPAERGAKGNPETSPEAEALGRRLEEIEAAAAAPVDALEPALRAIIEATGAAAGALCLYDQRRDLLRLAAEVGLSDDGCHRLRTVRRGDINSWDMPLHGLLNRRAYLIEKASQNRYVPPLVEDLARVRTVACLPLLAGTTPVGSIVLVTVMPRVFTERDIRGLEQALRALAKMIEALRRREAAVSSSTRAPVAPPTVRADLPRAPRSERPARGPDEPTGADAEHVRSLAAALEAAQRDQARLAAALQTAEAERARLAELVRGEAPAIDHAEVERLRARLAEAEAGAAHEQRAREELEAALQRGMTAGQHDLRGALEAARRAEAANVTIVAENAGLVAELERLRAGMPVDEARAAERRDADRLRARLAESEAGAAHEQRAREQLEAALERSTTESQRALRDALEAARTANAAKIVLEAEKARLEAEIEKLRAGASADERHAADRAEVDRLRAQLAESEAGAAHAHRAREELEAAVQRGASASQLEVRRALDAARQAEAARVALTAQNERLMAELAQLASGAPGDDNHVAELMAEVDRLRARLAEAEAGAAHEHRAREELEASLQRSTSEGRRELRNDLEAAWRAEAARSALAAENARLTAELKRLERDGARTDELAGLANDERETLAKSLEEARGREHELALKCDRLSELTAELERDRDRLNADVEGGAKARGHLEEALARGLEEARTREQALAARLEAREQEFAALTAERAAAGAALENVSGEGDRLRDTLAAAEAERDRLAADVEGAAAARVRLEQALATNLEEARAREQEVTTRLEARGRELEALRTDRAAVATQLDAATAEGDGLREVVARLEGERDRLAADLEGAAAARMHLEQAIEQTAEEGRAREQELASRLSAHEGAAETLRTEHAAEVTAWTTRMDALQAEHDRLREATAALEAERDRVAADLEGAGAARSRLEAELTRAAEEARAHEQELRAQVEARERDVDALRTERAAEAASSTAQLETLGAECARLREALAALEAGQPTSEVAIELTAPEAPAEEQPAPAPAEEEPVAAAPSPSAGSPVVVLDTDQAWTRAPNVGRTVVVLEPKRNLAARLAELGPARVVVNLASAGALDALLSLRSAGFAGPFWGCLADPASNHALPLRLIEPAARPLEPEAVVASIGRFAKKGTRVVTVGDDVEAFVSLRQALARDGLSVSMAWNGRQAEELFPVVRPTLVVLDLELPGKEAPGLVARLAGGRSAPDLVLIGSNTDPSSDFATVLANSPRDSRMLSLSRLLVQVVKGTE